jgi:hypothetical protein
VDPSPQITLFTSLVMKGSPVRVRASAFFLLTDLLAVATAPVVVRAEG